MKAAIWTCHVSFSAPNAAHHAHAPNGTGETEDRLVDSVDHIAELGPAAEELRPLALLKRGACDPHRHDEDDEGDDAEFPELVPAQETKDGHLVQIQEAESESHNVADMVEASVPGVGRVDLLARRHVEDKAAQGCLQAVFCQLRLPSLAAISSYPFRAKSRQ